MLANINSIVLLFSQYEPPSHASSIPVARTNCTSPHPCSLQYSLCATFFSFFFFFLQHDVKKPKSTKFLHTVLLQEGGSTVTKSVQLTLKQFAGSNARATVSLETIHSESPTPPGTPVSKVISMSRMIEVCYRRKDATVVIIVTLRSLRNDDSETVTPKCKLLLFGKETNFFVSRCKYKMNLHCPKTKL